MWQDKDMKTCNIKLTRPKPVGHGYVFIMGVGAIGECLKLFPFLLGTNSWFWEGGGSWQF